MISRRANLSIKVCHLAMGDLWAGAEVQLFSLIEDLTRSPEWQIFVVLFNEGRLAEELRRIGVPVTVFPERSMGSLAIMWGLAKVFRAGHFDLVHTHKNKDMCLGSLAAVGAGVPCIVRTVHGLPEPFTGIQALRMRAYDFLEECTIRLCVKRLIAVSSQIFQVLKDRYGPEKVVQIHNGVRLGRAIEVPDALDMKRSLGLSPSCRIIGTVGRLTAVKWQEGILECLRQLSSSKRDVYCLIVGDGPLREELERKAKELAIEDRVRFLGHRNDTGNLMRAMDIFVLPSLHEGVPMAILEAMALGRPIVATHVGGIPEVLTDQVHGVLVPPRDSKALAKACESLLDDPSLAEAYGREGKRRVEQEFSSRVMGARVASLYREIVASR